MFNLAVGLAAYFNSASGAPFAVLSSGVVLALTMAFW